MVLRSALGTASGAVAPSDAAAAVSAGGCGIGGAIPSMVPRRLSGAVEPAGRSADAGGGGGEGGGGGAELALRSAIGDGTEASVAPNELGGSGFIKRVPPSAGSAGARGKPQALQAAC